MSALNDEYGPKSPCKRTACADGVPHLGGAHIDPTSDLYDGPETALNALPGSCRTAAYALLGAARQQGWDRKVIETALHHMAREILDQRSHIAAVRVDRDRGISAAMERAEDCEQHGGDLRHERHQAYWFWMQNQALNDQRLAWLSACHDIQTAFQGDTSERGAWVGKRVDAASRAQDRIAKRYEKTAPTHADCIAAGKCEHPPTPPHEACDWFRQPTLFEMGAAV